MENIFVADIQFFRDNEKKIVLKSFAVSKLFDDDFIQYFVFKPPYNFEELNYLKRNEANHVTKYYHQMTWEEGYVNYDEIENIIRSTLKNASEVLVKGDEKIKYLNKIMEKNICYNAENLSCPNLKTLKTFQTVFTLSPVGFRNVYALKVWFRNFFQTSMENIENSIRKFNDQRELISLNSQEIYFLPVNYIIEKFHPNELCSLLYKLPPHSMFNNAIQKYIDSSNEYDKW
uniref:Uncharacterized protein n=1 Tax=Cacopsylla melanoneura TaxID=428564 RepID=A0A8D9DUK0_9HEMI